MSEHEKTPWNPSVRATARVKDVLPAPTECRFCGEPVSIANNSVFYGGRSYGEWPWAYLCEGCGARVGMHPFTAIPLGTLADLPTRKARKDAHEVFDPLWKFYGLPRSQVYAWLAEKLGIEIRTCHISWFDEAMCRKVIQVCRDRLKGGNTGV